MLSVLVLATHCATRFPRGGALEEDCGFLPMRISYTGANHISLSLYIYIYIYIYIIYGCVRACPLVILCTRAGISLLARVAVFALRVVRWVFFALVLSAPAKQGLSPTGT